MKKSLITLFVFALLLFVASNDSLAQCVMCKLNAENAAKHQDPGIGEGINNGIVYLMGIPYGLLMIGGVVFFREKIFGFLKR